MTNVESGDSHYRIREPYRNAIEDYLGTAEYPPNWVKLVYELAPDFDINPNSYGSPKHRLLQFLLELSLKDLIEIEHRVKVLPPVEHSSPNAAFLHRYELISE